jgi:hypothetical protein
MALKKGDKVTWKNNPSGILGTVTCRVTNGTWRDRGQVKPVTKPVIEVRLVSTGKCVDFLESDLKKA